MFTEEPSIFTLIINGKIPGNIAFEDEMVAVLISLEGHPLIIPKKHYRDIYVIPEDVAAHIMKIAVRTAKTLKQMTKCDGINLIQSNGAAAGQEVFHFHMHVKPRFKDDDTVLSWNTSTKPEEFRLNLTEKIKAALANN